MLKRKAAAKKPTKSTTKPVNPKGNKSHGSSNKHYQKRHERAKNVSHLMEVMMSQAQTRMKKNPDLVKRLRKRHQRRLRRRKTLGLKKLVNKVTSRSDIMLQSQMY
jgi:hypothetical protein